MNYLVILPIILIAGLIGTIIYVGFSSKGRKSVMNSMMKNNLEVLKDMQNGEMGETLKDLSKTAINVKKSILEDNEDALKEIAEIEANIEKNAIKTKAQAVKEGFSATNSAVKKMFCKHCGANIDNDSKFCKNCGNKQ